MIEKTIKKSCINAKYEIFENAVKSLKRIQIEFSIAKKYVLSVLVVFQKLGKFHKCNSSISQIFVSYFLFFDVCETWKK